MTKLPRGQRWFIERCQKMGYKSNVGGVCFGISNMAMQCFLTEGQNGINTFNSRLYQFSKHTLDQIGQLTATSHKHLSEEVNKQLLDWKAFVEGVETYQKPSNYGDHFGKKPLTQSTFHGLGFVLPLKLSEENKAIQLANSFGGSYSAEELVDYFSSLESTLKAAEKPVSFMLDSAKHAISVHYDPLSKPSWIFVDANQLPAKMMSSIEVAASVMEAFHLGKKSDSSSRRAIFQTSIFTVNNNTEIISKAVDNWKKQETYKKIHQINKEKLIQKDYWGRDWLHIAGKYGDHATIEEIINYIKQDNFARELISFRQDSITFPFLAMVASRGNLDATKLLFDYLNTPAESELDNAEGSAEEESETESDNSWETSDDELGFLSEDSDGEDNEFEPQYNFLYYIAKQDQPDFVAPFLTTKELFSKTIDNQTLIHIAAKFGSIEFFKAVFSQMNAIGMSETEIFQALFQKNRSGKNALHLAAKHGKAEVLDFLLEKFELLKPKKTAPEEHQEITDIPTEEIYEDTISLMDEDKNNMSFVDYIIEGDDQQSISILEKKYPELRAKAIENQDISRVNNYHLLFQAVENGTEFKELLEKLSDGGKKYKSLGQKNAQGQTIFHKAVGVTNRDVLNLIAEIESDKKREYILNIKDKDRQTILHLASALGKEELVKLILGQEFSSEDAYYQFLSQKNAQGDTALHLACVHGHCEIAKYLLVACPQNQKQQLLILENQKGQNSLHLAAMQGMEGIVEDIVTICSDYDFIDATDIYGQNAIHYAVLSKNKTIVEVLLENSLNGVGQKDSFAAIPLLTALERGDKETVAAFLEHIDEQHWFHNHKSLLHIAAEHGNLYVVEALLEAKKDILDEKTTDFDRTALYLAAQRGHSDVVRLLLSRGANPTLAQLNASQEITNLIIQVETELTNDQKNLYQAVRKGDVEQVRELLQKLSSACYKVKCTYQDVPLLFYAAKCKEPDVVVTNYQEIIKLLLEAGANIQDKYNNQTLLDVAAIEIQSFLIELGAKKTLSPIYTSNDETNDTFLQQVDQPAAAAITTEPQQTLIVRQQPAASPRDWRSVGFDGLFGAVAGLIIGTVVAIALVVSGGLAIPIAVGIALAIASIFVLSSTIAGLLTREAETKSREDTFKEPTNANRLYQTLGPNQMNKINSELSSKDSTPRPGIVPINENDVDSESSNSNSPRPGC